MYPKLQEIIHQAESKYLQEEDLNQLQQEISALKEKTRVYKTLRDKEIEIFQAVADQLVTKLSDEDTTAIEDCLRQWLLVTRYCAMAMLLNNPEFLERRLLEWLTDIVKIHQSQSISDTLYSLLMVRLGKVFSDQDLAYIKPFLKQANNHLVKVTASVAEENEKEIKGKI